MRISSNRRQFWDELSNVEDGCRIFAATFAHSPFPLDMERALP